MAFVVRTTDRQYPWGTSCDYLMRLAKSSYTMGTKYKATIYPTLEGAKADLAELRELIGGEDFAAAGWHVEESAVATITEELRAAVTASGYSAYAVAKVSGVSQSVISRWLSGERDITLKVADRINAGIRLARPADLKG